jgi:hypothetical protein
MTGIRVDYTEKRFGKLLVIKFYGQNEHRSSLWLCQCDCGNERIVDSSNLRNGNTSSCGKCTPNRGNKENFKGKEIASFNRILNNYRNNAKKRNILFELTEDQFKILTKQNCFYCNCSPSQVSVVKSGSGNYIYNGIDRLDSKQGYTMDNTVPCCGRCNEAKNDLSYEDFVKWIESVHKNLSQINCLRIKNEDGIIVPFIVN